LNLEIMVRRQTGVDARSDSAPPEEGSLDWSDRSLEEWRATVLPWEVEMLKINDEPDK
jgi:hypothetical protein